MATGLSNNHHLHRTEEAPLAQAKARCCEVLFMAIQLVHDVLYLTLKPGRKLTLAVLAEHADENGICWPSQALLSVRTSMSARKVRDHLRGLESEEWLITQVRQGPRFVNRYLLNVQQIKSNAEATKNRIKKDKNDRWVDGEDLNFATPDLSDPAADFENTLSDESDNNPGPTGPTETSTNLHIKTKRERSVELSEVAKLQKLSNLRWNGLDYGQSLKAQMKPLILTKKRAYRPH